MIAVETERNAVTAQQAAEQAEIAAGVFAGEECGGQDLAGSVVEKAEQGKCGAAIFEPAVEAGVEQEHFAFASPRETAQAMSRCASFTRGAKACGAQNAAKGFPAQR